MKWLISWWHRRQRAVDVAILWPAIRQQTESLDHARMAFALHAMKDEAWICLPAAEFRKAIEELR